jgi:hypothetical protein
MPKRPNYSDAWQQPAEADTTSLPVFSASYTDIYGTPDLPIVHVTSDKTQIQMYGCTLTAAGLDIPDTISEADMENLAQALFAFEGHIQLFIGDMLAAEERLRYGAITALAVQLGKDSKTLSNWKSICKSVTTSRRQEVLSANPGKKPLTMKHYQFVVAMTDDQQLYWLNLAMANEWSVKELRDAIKGKALLAAENATPSLFDKSHMPRPAALEPLYRKARQGDTTALAEIQRHIAEYEKWLRAIQESLGLR